MSELDRFREFYNESMRNQYEAAEVFGISASRVSETLKGKNKKIPEQILIIAELRYGLNKEWVRTGQGEKYLPKSETKRLTDEEMELVENYRALDKEKKKQLLEQSEFLRRFLRGQQLRDEQGFGPG